MSERESTSATHPVRRMHQANPSRQWACTAPHGGPRRGSRQLVPLKRRRSPRVALVERSGSRACAAAALQGFVSGATTTYQTIQPINKAQTEQHDSQRSPSHPLAHSDRDVGLRVVSGHSPRDCGTRHNLLLALPMPLITSCERPRKETTCDGVSDVLALFRAVTSIRTTAAVVGKAAAAMLGSGTQPGAASVAAWVSISPVARDRPSVNRQDL